MEDDSDKEGEASQQRRPEIKGGRPRRLTMDSKTAQHEMANALRARLQVLKDKQDQETRARALPTLPFGFPQTPHHLRSGPANVGRALSPIRDDPNEDAEESNEADEEEDLFMDDGKGKQKAVVEKKMNPELRKENQTSFAAMKAEQAVSDTPTKDADLAEGQFWVDEPVNSPEHHSSRKHRKYGVSADETHGTAVKDFAFEQKK